MLKGTSLDTYNIKSETVNNAIIQLGDIDDTGKGKHFTSRFIQAGLVKIEGHGIVLLKKETLDMSLQSMVGAPVIIKHQDVTDENADELRCGVISKAYFNDFDGWYYAEGIIWDTKAQELINNKDWSVSCSYDFLSYNDEGGVENNIKYDKEFTSLNFTHLALVNNPRYERANIVFNCKVENDKWITIKPHGDDSDDYRRLKLEDGESPKEAIDRVYKKKDKEGTEADTNKSDSKGDTTDKDNQDKYLKKGDLELGKVYKLGNIFVKPFQDDDGDLAFYDRTGAWGEGSLPQKFLKSDLKNLERVEEYDKLTDKELKFLSEKSDRADSKEEKQETKAEILEKSYKSLDKNNFIPKSQKFAIKRIMQGDEYKHFADKIEEVAEIIKNAPNMYETDGIKLEDKKPILHYFGGAYDNYVYEIDKETGEMFGAVNMGYGYELGYSSMAEINSVPSIELDLYFDGKQPKELRKNIDNSKEKEMSLIEEIKKLIRKVENNKETEEMIENEKTDKRKLIDEVAGIMKSAGCDDEDIRTAIGKMEKIGYDASEDSKADNKKVKNEDEEDKKEDKKEDKEVDNEDAEDKKEAEDLEEDAKEDVKNKCKNDKSSFDKINEIYNSVKTLKEKTEYETRDVKLKNAEEYFG